MFSLFHKVIDTNITGKEYVDENEKYYIFILNNIYSYFNAIYYAARLSEYKCIAIWDKSHLPDFDIDFSKKYFYKFFFVRDLRNDNHCIRLIIKLIHIGHLKRLSLLYKFLKKMSKVFILVYDDNDPFTQTIIEDFGMNKNVVLLEEGMGTYTMLDYNDASYCFLQKIAYRIFGISCRKSYIGHSPQIKYIIAKEPKMIDKRKVQCRKVIKANNMFLDTAFISECRLEFGFDKMFTLDLNYDYYLYLGGPISEKHISEEEEVKLISTISEMLSSKEKIVIKLHPRENINKYNSLIGNNKVIILDLNNKNWIPVEFIAKFINPVCILTVISTAAHTLTTIGIKAKICYLLNCLQHNDKEVFLSKVVYGKNSFQLSSPNDIAKIKKIDYIEQHMNKDNNDLDILFLKGIDY